MTRAAFLLLMSTATVRGQVGPDWQPWGPAPITEVSYTGRISAIATHPTDPEGYFVAGADGGVWRRRSGDLEWTALTDSLPTTAIGALALDPTDANTLYAGTGEANFAYHSRFGVGLYKSTDGGENWVHLAEATFAGRCFSKIVVDGTNPSTVFAAVTPAGGFLPARSAAKGHPQADGPFGVFKSEDGGHTWQHLVNGLPALAATDLALHPFNPQVLFACIGEIFGDSNNGVYRSTDGGQSWNRLAGGLPVANVGRISIATAPTLLPDRVYVSITESANSTGGSASLLDVYRSDDSGDNWTPLFAPNFMATYGWYLNVISIQPTNPNVVIVGGVTAHRSTNAGGNWTTITPPHVDLHAIAWDASGRLLVGDDGGVHRSNNLGNSWSHLNNGLGLIQFYAGLSLDPADEDTLFGGTQDNGTNKRLGPGDWSQVFGGDGGATAVDPTNSNIVFCESQGTGNLYRSTNGGLSLNWTGSGLSGRNCFLPPFEIDSSDPQRMVYGTHVVFESTNGGAGWSSISPDLTATGTGAIHSIAIAPSDPQTIWVTTNDGNVQVTFNGGVQWALVRQGLPGWFRIMRQIFVSPDDDETAYLAGSAFGADQVLRTVNGGQSWAVLDGNLPDVPVNVIAVDTRPFLDVLYAGAEAGVYRSLDDGATWHRFGKELPNAPVIDLRLDLPRGRMLAATQGRGAWLIDIWQPGDVNGDGAVDMLDVSSLVGVLLQQNTDPDWVLRSDVNADGASNGRDISPFVDVLTKS
ncbi:MAG: dockerin type I domain-containing protein [Planctomycetota bacterium]|nr:dockerin type I domain-containing protein [Planctomycetota bacterium]